MTASEFGTVIQSGSWWASAGSVFRGRPGHVPAVRPDPPDWLFQPRQSPKGCASRHGFRLPAFRFRPGRCAGPPATPRRPPRRPFPPEAGPPESGLHKGRDRSPSAHRPANRRGVAGIASLYFQSNAAPVRTGTPGAGGGL